MISAAVHEILLPIMKEIKNDLNSVKNDSSSLNKTVILQLKKSYREEVTSVIDT